MDVSFHVSKALIQNKDGRPYLDHISGGFLLGGILVSIDWYS